jgi:hypothetical protein
MHWEWRGFGRIDSRVRERIMQLPLAYPTARTVTDCYLWVSGLQTNIKLRSWPGGASLKFKRRLSGSTQDGVQLWVEDLEEDFIFPLSTQTVAKLGRELRAELALQGPVEDPTTLLAELQTQQVSAVTVEKLRWLHQWESDGVKAFVELAELRAPQPLETVGIEDHMGLYDGSSEEMVDSGRVAVVVARDKLGLPGSLEVSSYLEQVASWSE